MSDLISKIKLLDDPDENIYLSIRDSIIKDGISAIPILEESWEREQNPLIQQRIEEIIEIIQFTNLIDLFKAWKAAGAKDIIYGAYLVSKYIYTDLKWSDIELTIEKIKKDVWIELNHNLTALEKINLLNYIIFDIWGYSVTIENPFSPNNFYINHLINTKKGNELLLSILYIGIAQRLNIPVFGVSLHNNYIMCYLDQLSAFEAFGDTTDSNVLFYITPHGKGTVFGRKEIDFFLKKLKLEPKRKYYNPISNLEMIKEMLKQLIISFNDLGNSQKSVRLTQIRNIL